MTFIAMDKKQAYSQLKEFSLGLGLDLFGVADISRMKKEFVLSSRALEGLEWAVCLGARLSGKVLEELLEAPTRIYSYHYRTVNIFLDQCALRVCAYLQSKGYSALPIPATQIVDWKEHRAHLSHRHVAVAAGLGWIGRNNLLVNDKFGSQLRLVTILTDMPLEPDKAEDRDCAACRLCVEVCPAQAIKENSADFQRFKCLEKLKEFQKQRVVDQYICGVCVNACKGAKK